MLHGITAIGVFFTLSPVTILRVFRSFCFVWFALLLVWANIRAEPEAGAVATLNLGVVSDEYTRDLEDMLLINLQKNAGLHFLERTNLPKLTGELMLGDFLGGAKWESCDVLVLLNSFASAAVPKERQLVVRLISTRTLQTLGLWVYPSKGSDASTLAAILAGRMEPVLMQNGAGGGKAVSVSLLRAETPALKVITEAATYTLGAQIQNRPGLSLLERWNVRDPEFEQWLRQTEPANVKKPDVFVEGSLTEVNGQPGFRLSINGGEPGTFAGGDQELAGAAAAAARAIAGVAGTGVKPAGAPEFLRFEKDARWFWKWGLFRHAAVAAETAVYLGSKNQETRYIRALASQRSKQAWGYLVGLEHADTPLEDGLQNGLHGLDCFLEIPPPGADAKSLDRWKHMIFSESALSEAGELLQGLYLSERDLPGTAEDRFRLRQLASQLAAQATAYAIKYQKDRSYHAAYLEHIENSVSRHLPYVVANYAGFMAKDAKELVALYTAAFEVAAITGARDDNGIPRDMFRVRSSGAHYPWVADWDNRPPSAAVIQEIVFSLIGHPKFEVRVPALLIPVRYAPAKPAEKERDYYAAWLRWVVSKLAKEQESLVVKPTKYSFQVLATVGAAMDDMRPVAGAGFPEAEWRQCIAGWQAAMPASLSGEYAGDTKRYLDYLMEASLKNTAAGASVLPVPSNGEMVAVYRYFMVAPPPLGTAVRKERSSEYQEIVRVAEANRPPPKVWKMEVKRDDTVRPLRRKPVVAENPSPAIRRFGTDLLFAGNTWGGAVSFAQGADDTLWFMFTRNDYDMEDHSITFVRTDAKLSTVLQTVRVEDFKSGQIGWGPAVFTVEGGVIYWVDSNRFFILKPGAATPDSVALPNMGAPRVWFAGGRWWVTGDPGLIYEYFPKDNRLRMVSSSMRTPAMNALDGRDAYRVSRIFEHEGAIYAWIDEKAVYVRDETALDWREIHTARRHLSPNKSYPADILFKAIGSGVRVESQENSVAVLALDPGFGGVLRGDYRRYPAQIRAPDGSSIYDSDMRPVATTEHALWAAYYSQGGVSVGGWQRQTGIPMNYPVLLPKGSSPWYLHALPDGFVLVEGSLNSRLFYLSRERMTETK